MVFQTIILSIAIVISSFIIAGAIVATQVLSGDFILDNIEGEGEGFGNSRQDPVPLPGNGTVVRIVDDAESNSYSPNPLEVEAGQTVTWVNDDSTIHTVTSTDGTFESDILQSGEIFNHTFDRQGEYPYYCDLHPAMVGTVSVS
jgi:plastocyanin